MRFVVVQDHKENRRKCTLSPLERHPRFSFLRLERPGISPGRVEVGPGVLLHVEGPPLSRSDAPQAAGGSLVIIDSTWARVSRVLDRIVLCAGCRLERRSLPPGFVTAYPRVSKLHRDPPSGLASVEAIFAATAILGEPLLELLDRYRWAPEFLARNEGILRRLCPELPEAALSRPEPPGTALLHLKP